ncbi:unnamed protein product, partial [Durusdinium trenchii]
MISTYQSAYGSLDHWATSKEDQMRRSRPSQSQRQRRSTSQPVGQASAKFNPMWLRNSFNPFIARELPRGKFSSFPTNITRQLPKSPDPLGFTSYRQ